MNINLQYVLQVCWCVGGGDDGFRSSSCCNVFRHRFLSLVQGGAREYEVRYRAVQVDAAIHSSKKTSLEVESSNPVAFSVRTSDFLVDIVFGCYGIELDYVIV